MTEESTAYHYLQAINSPADLRKSPVGELPKVCDELRRDIIRELSVNPGHLASSLGVVELTVALHYVYDTPYDRIVWDVGHQAYGHKILTGRRKGPANGRRSGSAHNSDDRHCDHGFYNSKTALIVFGFLKKTFKTHISHLPSV